MTKKISVIWAQDETGLIGKDDRLPWSLPADLQHFKETTTGHALVMGRVTFEGMGKRALPNRVSIVLTHDKDYVSDNERVLVLHSVAEVLEWYAKQERTLYIIGGGQIFSAFEPYLEEVVRTDIHACFDGDTYFPSNFDWSVFDEVESVFYAKDEKNTADFTTRRFVRKEKK